MPYQFSKHFNVGRRPVGPGHPALLVAEIGGNHGGDLQLAEVMVKAAAEAGAGAVKFQAYKTNNFLSARSPYFDALAREELAFEHLLKLFKLAHRFDLAVGVTVFDTEGLLLARQGRADFIKIASGDLTHFALLEEAAQAEKPVFISTGAALAKEVEEALTHLAAARDLVVFQCAALYPAPPDSANLEVMKAWQNQGLLAGYSDHTLGLEAAQAALALGAVVLEKHFTTDQGLPGGDNAISVRPAEWRQLAAWAKLCPTLLGQRHKAPHPLEWNMRPLIRRVVVAARTLSAGCRLEKDDLACMRPPPLAPSDAVLGPDQLSKILGRTLKFPVGRGSPVRPTDLEDAP